ncbi:Retrovirus-related Pol polyprotein from transposon TNT 1-94 [Hypsizygus marmoreus]|uniref:Retrovirus-related Pol polyprotein from transposon TNT 1-94 n=1 Tax=Hypsizygus marmoreus TaxID=39966 RepID=A0A369KA91_HYPMA|nr:Retrovirus-related Pol polyprotein from transposon TNT 1-94 [Hypsizygus marmoreus]
MGPEETYDVSTNKVTVPKLASNGSNWPTYSARIMNTLTSKKLRRHVIGTARQPEELQERNGSFYKEQMLNPLSDKELEEHEDAVEEWLQKEAQVREIIYGTVDQSTFLQIKNEPTAATVWKKLTSIHADKGIMFETDLLMRLQTSRYVEGDDMRKHLTDLTSLKERLAEIGSPLSDESFASYIRTSLSLSPSYRPLFTTLATAAREKGKPTTSDELKWHLLEEANTAELEENMNKSNSAMLAAHVRFRGDNTKGNSGKSKGKGKSKDSRHCSNCNKDGHTIDQCFEEGGGKAGDAPKWWVKKHGNKSKGKGKAKSANVTDKVKKDDEDENYAFLTLTIDSPSDDETINVALYVTSGHDHEAHAASPSAAVIIDCGASSHFSPSHEKFLNYQEISPEPIRAADGRTFSAIGKGDLRVQLPMKNGEKSTPILLKKVYYAPQMAFTLVSVSCLDHAGCSLHIEDGMCVIRSPKPQRRIIGRVPELRGLYRADSSTVSSSPQLNVNSASKLMSISELHRRMGHINHKDLREAVRLGMITGIELDMTSEPEFCEPCVKGKATRHSFPKESETEYTKYGEKVVADLWGPAQVESLGGAKYYYLNLDKYSHEEYVDFLRRKSDTFAHYKEYEAWVKTQCNTPIVIYGCDRGGEFMSKEFSEHLKQAGTVRHLTVHDSPQSNGAAERANRTHVEGARTMMIAAGLPKYLWAEAIRHHVWLRNRTPTSALPGNITPYERATTKKPNLSMVQEWGAVAYVKRRSAGKLEPKIDEGHFVGIDDESKGYRIYWPKKRSVTVERDVYFNKDAALNPDNVQIEGEWDLPSNPDVPQASDSQSDTSPSLVKPEIVTEKPPAPAIVDRSVENVEKPAENLQKSPKIIADNSQSEDVPPTTAPHLRTRRNSLQGLPQYDENQYGRGHRRKPAKNANFSENAFVVDAAGLLDPSEVEIDDFGPEWVHEAIESAMLASEDEPPVKDALSGGEKQEWSDAIEAELAQIEKLETWELTQAPTNVNIIPCRYVLRRKRDANGNIVRYKARLVAKGFMQRFGEDYDETFAPTVRSSTLRILLAIAASRGAAVEQADAKNAYLNSFLKENEVIYMKFPPYYRRFRTLPAELANLPDSQLVCKLRRPLYGTKQGAHHWYQELCRIFKILGYTVCMADEAVFYKFEDDKFTIVAAATDDFTIIGESTAATSLIKKQLSEYFEIVDLGPINWLLGVSITRDLSARTMALGQQAYIEQILARFGLEESRAAVTPMEPGIDLSPDSPAVSDKILTPAEKTRYREMIGSLITTHFTAVTRVFRYLRGTTDLKLVIGGHNPDVTGYSDADWASHMHRHSISGFAFFVGFGVVSWSAKKQAIITLSSTESEYVALTHASKDIIWIHKLLTELSFFYQFSLPTTLYSDNQGAIRLSKDSTFHGRTKHIDVHFHFIRQTVSSGHIRILFCPTSDMIADIFTKSLARVKFEKFRELLGVI